MADTIFLLVIFLLEILLFYYLPTLNGGRTLFGIVLKNDDFQTYGSPILREYRRELLSVAAAGLIGLSALASFSVDSMTIAYIAAHFAIIYVSFKHLRQTWRSRDRQTITRLASPLTPRRLRDFSNSWFEATVILLAVAPSAILAFYYPYLPDVVPIHWNISGEADRWERKSLASVFFLPILAAYLQIFWIILKQDIVAARFRVPAEHAEQVLSLKEISLRANVGMVDWCRLSCGALLLVVSLFILSPIVASSVQSALNIATWANLALLLSGMAFYIYRMILANREVKSLTGQTTFQTAGEMEGWHNGLYYYNRGDAAFMVEKPGGVGYTINFAHKRAMLYLALVLVPEMLAIFSFILMKSQ